MARIVSVHRADLRPDDLPSGRLRTVNMAYGRWIKIAEELAALGHEVHLAVPDCASLEPVLGAGQNLRMVPLSKVDWAGYDVVKASFHRGFETLKAYGGANHPFILSHLSSVVAEENRPGIYFFDQIREGLFETQKKVVRACRYISVLNAPAKALLEECCGANGNVICVAGGADRIIPVPGPDPYGARETDGLRVLFAGNIYTDQQQAEANRVLSAKLNRLGQLLRERGASLHFLGGGDISRLNPRFVRYLGCVTYDEAWQYFYHGDVGVVVAAGSFHHNNESTKIYSYLRAGLPVVSESGFPNDNVVRESGFGEVVDEGNLEGLANRVTSLTYSEQDRMRAMAYILDNHTWDRRAAVWAPILNRHFGSTRIPIDAFGQLQEATWQGD